MSKAEFIRKAPPTRWEPVVCNEWKPAELNGEDFKVWVRSMSGPDREQFERDMIRKKNSARRDPFSVKERFLKACVFDEPDGATATFAEFTREELLALNTAALERLVNASFSLSGITNQDVGELTGN